MPHKMHINRDINFEFLKWRQHLLLKTIMMDHVMDTQFELQYKAVTEFK